MSPPTQILQWNKKSRLKLMRSAIIKKARQDEQNQAKTTDIIYIQVLVT